MTTTNNIGPGRQSKPVEKHTTNDATDSMRMQPSLIRRIWGSFLAKWWPFWFASMWWFYISPHMLANDPHARFTAHFRDRARKAAVAELLKPFRDRDRSFFTPSDSAMLLDDSGGACITLFDDEDACHYFLIWLHAKRAQRTNGGAV